ncbi:MAG: NADH-quinone oxidoreductase subunit C [Candidatus Marinimicrobia bacterium]|jgi:NADH-quinone oxidoreductase subunit C|nr:NADH-quinone oxidoreductase subunit C [Candidatus Neomarinimicrobiota bacterium]
MTDDRDKLISEVVEKALQGDMDAINNIEDRVIRSKAKAALHKAKKAAKAVESSASDANEDKTETSPKAEQTIHQKMAILIEEKESGSVISQEGEEEACIYIKPESWESLAPILRNDDAMDFDSLQCITGMDMGEGILESRYNFHSMKLRHAIEIRIAVPMEKPDIYSIEQIWRIGDWFEREVYDMFGIIFTGHRNLKRMLLPDDWEGWPLRKDYETPQSYHGIAVPKVKEEWE